MLLRFNADSEARASLVRRCLMMAGLAMLIVPPAVAGVRLVPVHFKVAGRELVLRLTPLSDGTETYIPIAALSALGETGNLSARGDTVIVADSAGGNRHELAVARPNGEPMLALSDVARLVNGVVARPDAMGPDGKSAPGQHGDTVYLLARVLDIRFSGGALRVLTSFPVPFRARGLTSGYFVRGYVDCLGAVVGNDFKPQPVLAVEKQAIRLRCGQNGVDVARAVVELAAGVTLVEIDAPMNSLAAIAAGTRGGSGRRSTPRSALAVASSSGVVQTRLSPDAHSAQSRTGKAAPTVSPADPGQSSADHRGAHVTGAAAALTHTSGEHSVSRGRIASRAGGRVHRLPTPVTVSGMVFTAEGDSKIRIDFATSGHATAYVHYLPGTTHMVVEIPGASLQLAQPEDADKTVDHALLTGIHATMAQDAPPVTRIELDTTRVLGYGLSASADRLSIELRVPRNASGGLEDKLIVVDPGHGGAAAGASGHGGGTTVYEKDITLAIGLKLRAVLEAAGARVVMTRDHDMDIGLYDRTRLAGNVGADLFISIHNDSNGAVNSASGTSTYYHMGDANSRALAICVQQAVSAVTGLPSRGALSDGILYASGLAVLRTSTMPAVLCEVAYINNTGDRSKLVDSDFQTRVAEAICSGLRNYVEGAGTSLPAPKPDDGGANLDLNLKTGDDAPPLRLDQPGVSPGDK